MRVVVCDLDRVASDFVLFFDNAGLTENSEIVAMIPKKAARNFSPSASNSTIKAFALWAQRHFPQYVVDARAVGNACE